jgi:ribosomal protein S12 methylthiotransferase accessory factor
MVELRSRPLFLELDLSSEQGRALLRSVSDRYGPKIVDAAGLASRIFMLRSPWAPGLRFVGAETKKRVTIEDGCTLLPISLSGSGEALEEAFVSCIGEGVDRLAQIEWPGDVTIVSSVSEIRDRVWPAAISSIEQAIVAQNLPGDVPLAWVTAKPLNSWTPSANARDMLVPADWCLRRATDGIRLPPRSALSVGVAAGPTFDWAASRAVLELIERDAACLWWSGGKRGKAIRLDHPGMVGITQLVANLRQNANDRALWMLDITTDIGVPVVVALSCGTDGRQLAYGLASRFSIEDAMRAAILELCQTELAILLAVVKQTEDGEDKLLPADRAHLARHFAIDANACELLHPNGVQLASRAAEPGSELGTIGDALGRAGVEVAFVELTRPEYGIPVVRAVAPGLQPMPYELVTERLRRAIVEFGGGTRYTGGIPLIV